MTNAREVFTKIFETNHWGGGESRSGQGSSLAATDAIRTELPRLIEQLGVHSVLDVPCGDLNWMEHVELGCPYIGVDVVPAVIAMNKIRHGRDDRSFFCLDMIHDELPDADLIICRDALQHLPHKDVDKVLTNFNLLGARYLLVTTYPQTGKNKRNLKLGEYFPYNLSKAPFELGEPLYQIAEGGLDRNEPDKTMNLYKLPV